MINITNYKKLDLSKYLKALGMWLLWIMICLSSPAIATENLYFYHNDHLGTPQILTNENQEVIWRAKFKPFGEVEIVNDTVENNLRFPGQYYDEESGLHYNYHRYYDPLTGRYITSDPIGLAGGINTYAYVSGNPINRIDPLGLKGGGFTNAVGWISFGFGTLGGYELAAVNDNIQSNPFEGTMDPQRFSGIANDLAVGGGSTAGALYGDFSSRSSWGLVGILWGTFLYDLLHNDADASGFDMCPIN